MFTGGALVYAKSKFGVVAPDGITVDDLGVHTGIETSVVFEHDTIRIEFPISWMMETGLTFPGEGAASLDIYDVLELVWGDVVTDAQRAGITGSGGVDYTWQNMFGCWSIPDRGDDSLFFRGGKGPPAWYVMYAWTLLAANSDLIEDRVRQTDAGVGFGDALGQYLKGGGAWRSEGHSDRPGKVLKTVYLNVLSGDPEFAYVRTEKPKVDCGEFDGLDATRYLHPWDDYTVSFHVIDSMPVPGASHLWIGYSSGDPTAYARDVSGGAPQINVRANRIAAESEVVDRFLHAAWMALEYWAEATSVDEMVNRFFTHAAPAVAAGRFALRRVLSWSNLYLHEFGHIYNYVGHCEYGKSCFMDHALDRFDCGVRARYGLPQNDDYWAPGEEYAGFNGGGCTNGALQTSPDCGSGWGAAGRGRCRIAEPSIPLSAYMQCGWNWCDDASMLSATPYPFDDSTYGCEGVEPTQNSSGQEACEVTSVEGTMEGGDDPAF